MQKYKDLGLKPTPQRLAIFDYLEGNQDHPSAEDIYKSVSKKFPMMSFATVYNTLEALQQKNYLRELNIDPDKKRFDPNTNPHHHLICVTCKKIVDIYDDYKIRVPNRARKGFAIIGHHIEFYGLCPKCQSKKE